MKLGVPWNVKGLRPEARETARLAARNSGMSLGEWLNTVILEQAEEAGVRAPGHEDDDEETYAGELASVHERLDDLTRRIGQFTRTAEKTSRRPRPGTRGEVQPDRMAELIERLDRRMEQFVAQAAARPVSAQPQPYYAPQWPQAQPVMAAPPLQPGIVPVRPRPVPSSGPAAYAPAPKVFVPPPPLTSAPDRSVAERAAAEIAARQRALRGEPASAAAPAPAPLVPVIPTQDLSGLEVQLRKITDQIETLRRPGVEEAINALRDELGEIGRALNDAVPRRAIDSIERQIQELTHRIAEGRQAGADQQALSGLEHGLAEVRDALRNLTPAEKLVGFDDAVSGLAHKIDLIVAQKDPETLHQLEHAITTLREMAAHVASNDAIKNLSSQVHALGHKVEELSRVNAGDALSGLERRIEALSKAIAERAQNGGSVPPRLENLVQSLSEKIERIQESRAGNPVVTHLEDRIVQLVERIDASDSRLGHLEAIERGLADLLVQVEDMRAMKQADSLRAEAQSAVGVDGLKHDLARTQTTLEAVNGTLGHLVERLSQMEKEFREDRRPGEEAPAALAPSPPPPAPAPVQPKPALRPAPEPMPEPAPAPRLAEPKQATPAAAPQPAPRRAAKIAPINPELPPDQPLEPGSGPPRPRTGARIAVDAAAPAAPKSSFIAAARRAAKAVQEARQPTPQEPELPQTESSGGVMKRVKSLFVAASVAAIVVGGVQVGSQFLWNPGSPAGKKAALAPPRPTPASDLKADMLDARPLAPAPALPALQIDAPEQQPAPKEPLSITPPAAAEPDVTGSIPPARTISPADRLPAEIGGTRLRSAAASGDASAEYEIAMRYAEGRGVIADLGEAARWYERSASKGVALAQFRYATMLEKGVGVKKDLGQARRYYLAAAGRGNAKAMHNLAVLYAEGIDGKPDFGNAVQWFRKAAEHGVADSQYNLAVLLARGLGAQKDLAESYTWLALAAAQGDKEAARKRDEVAGKLDAKSLAAAQQDAKSFAVKQQPAEATVVNVPPGGWDDPVPGRGPASGKAGQSRTADAIKLGKR